MTIKALYCIEWTEYERGWGQRPDGRSYYPSKEAAMEAYNKVFEKRKNSSYTPDCYSNPSEPILKEVDEKLYREVQSKGMAWRH